MGMELFAFRGIPAILKSNTLHYIPQLKLGSL